MDGGGGCAKSLATRLLEAVDTSQELLLNAMVGLKYEKGSILLTRIK